MPNTILIILIQLVLILVTTNLFILLFNRRLAVRNRTITESLVDITIKHEKMLIDNTRQSQDEPINQKNESPLSQEVPAISPEETVEAALAHLLEQTEARMKSLAIKDTQITDETTAEEMACIVRYLFIENEQHSLHFANDSLLLWETLQPNIDKMTKAMQARPSLLNDTTLLEESISPDQKSDESSNPLSSSGSAEKTRSDDDIVDKAIIKALKVEKQTLTDALHQEQILSDHRQKELTQTKHHLDNLTQQHEDLNKTQQEAQSLWTNTEGELESLHNIIEKSADNAIPTDTLYQHVHSLYEHAQQLNQIMAKKPPLEGDPNSNLSTD